jgi:acylphosphatase
MEQKTGDLARVHILVTGRVQGVGFRAFVQHCGTQAGLTGWVRNLADDKVETIAEGPKESLEKFAEEVKAGPRQSRVDTARIDWEIASGEFSNFSFRYSV